MSISIQTNVASLTAQENLRVNTNFQNQTIQRLTSGYRINSAADDAAGLAVANKFRDDISELTQGVRNANDGVSQLQIVDGGLSNISNILDRLKTLATESASNTFTGNRATLNNEYQSLLGEINRQASNIGLVNNGSNNKLLQVYIGGGSSQANAQVSVDLSGTKNQVDSAGLGVGSSTIDAGGVTLKGNSITNLNNPNQMILTGHSTGATETFDFNYVNSNGVASSQAVTVTSSGSAGITVANALSQLNSELSSIGLSAAVNSSGSLLIGGTAAWSLQSAATAANGGGAGALDTTSQLSTDIAAGAQTNVNTGAYNATTAVVDMTGEAANETLAFSNGTVAKYVTIDTSATNGATTADEINAQTASMGIYALKTNGTTGLSLQSSGAFTVTMVGQSTNSKGAWGATAVGSQVTITSPDQSQSTTGNALAALTSIEAAVGQLGQVQGRVGAGENQLTYAINLAQSQITNFSSAQSQIRDADVAAEAANLTKAQVLQQASIAAMAQANSSSQSVLSLLKG